MEYMKHYELSTINEKISLDCSTFSEKVWIKVVDTTEKALVQTIIDFAKEKGITDLYLIDEEFVRTALLNEIERRKEGEQI